MKNYKTMSGHGKITSIIAPICLSGIAASLLTGCGIIRWIAHPPKGYGGHVIYAEPFSRSIVSLSYIPAPGNPCINPDEQRFALVANESIHLDVRFTSDLEGCGAWDRGPVILDSTSTMAIAEIATKTAAQLVGNRIRVDIIATFAPGFASIESQYALPYDEYSVAVHNVIMAPIRDDGVLFPNKQSFANAFHESMHAMRKALKIEKPQNFSPLIEEEIIANLFGFCVTTMNDMNSASPSTRRQVVLEYFYQSPLFKGDEPSENLFDSSDYLNGIISSTSHPSVKASGMVLRWLFSHEGIQRGCNVDFFTPGSELDEYLTSIGMEWR